MVAIYKHIMTRISKWVEYHTDSGYWARAKKLYKWNTGKVLDYSLPKDINEKLMWIERYWQHPLKTICSDKYAVRDYLRKQGMEEMLIPLIGVYNSVDEIDFDTLPHQFVLKCNHGSGYNLICRDKSTINIKQTKEQFRVWMSSSYDQDCMEIHYRDIPRKIICEPLISQTAPIEYQVWCINGRAQSLLVCRKNWDGSYDAWSYSLDWKPLNDRKNESEGTPPKPKDLPGLICKAELLAEPFPFLRVDFYDVEGKVYFAEMSFSPAANMLTAYTDEFVERMGKLLVLPTYKWPQTDWTQYRVYEEHIKRFVAAMNTKSKAIGMSSAQFDDPTGLSYLNKGTAQDVVKLMQSVLSLPGLVRLLAITSQYIWIWHYGGKPKRVLLHNTLNIDDLSSSQYEILAAKTGSDGYIHNVVMAVRYQSDIYIHVVLNAATEGRREACLKALLAHMMNDQFKISFLPQESILMCKISQDGKMSEIEAHNSMQVVPLLSVTKLLSLAIVLENIENIPSIIRISDIDIQRGSGVPLRRKTLLTKRGAILATILTSSNTAIQTLARRSYVI